MKVLVTFLALVAVCSAGRLSIDLDAVLDVEELTAYDYHNKIGIPLAEEIRLAEEESESNPSRIVGGSAARLGQFPYQAGLLIATPNGQSICGGSLLNNRRVLTAAHCWFDGRTQARSVTTVLGSITINSGGNRQTSTSVQMHGSYSATTLRNDIAIINLPSNVGFTANIAAIALPSGNELNDQFVGATGTASGFGLTRDGGGASNTLQHVNLPVIANNVCRSTFPVHVVDSTICTSGANGRSTCRGDSGGPLVVTRSGRRILIGVTSFGHSSGCQRGHPAAFARVTSFAAWIRQRL